MSHLTVLKLILLCAGFLFYAWEWTMFRCRWLIKELIEKVQVIIWSSDLEVHLLFYFQ